MPSLSTVTAPDGRSTLTSCTPGRRSSSSVTAWTQCPQVIPVTVYVSVTAMTRPLTSTGYRDDATPLGYQKTHPGRRVARCALRASIPGVVCPPRRGPRGPAGRRRADRDRARGPVTAGTGPAVERRRAPARNRGGAVRRRDRPAVRH